MDEAMTLDKIERRMIAIQITGKKITNAIAYKYC